MSNVELIPPSGRARNYRHGYKTAGKYSSEYSIWMNMRARCRNPKNNRYHLYGARGISVCQRWEVDFLNFLEDMGRRPSTDHSIDRIDNNGNYTPDNCRWATRSEQARNTRSSRFLEFKGRRLTLTEWAQEIGMDRRSLHLRLKSGWSIERALTEPIRGAARKDARASMQPATIFKEFPF